MNPYGEQQRPLWESFRKELDAAPMTAEQESRVVSAALDAFQSLQEIGEAVLAHHERSAIGTS